MTDGSNLMALLISIEKKLNKLRFLDNGNLYIERTYETTIETANNQPIQVVGEEKESRLEAVLKNDPSGIRNPVGLL